MRLGPQGRAPLQAPRPQIAHLRARQAAHLALRRQAPANHLRAGRRGCLYRQKAKEKLIRDYCWLGFSGSGQQRTTVTFDFLGPEDRCAPARPGRNTHRSGRRATRDWRPERHRRRPQSTGQLLPPGYPAPTFLLVCSFQPER